MRSTFIASDSVAREKLDWGARAWLTRIGNARAGSLVVIEVDLLPGCGHAFHLHPNQEEIVYSLDGEIEQWIGMEKEILRPGDSIVQCKQQACQSPRCPRSRGRRGGIQGIGGRKRVAMEYTQRRELLGLLLFS